MSVNKEYLYLDKISNIGIFAGYFRKFCSLDIYLPLRF